MPPTPTTDPNAFTINVLDFGADPTGVKDSTQAIQNAIDFAAGVKTLAQTAPATMDPARRALYQVYEDARRAKLGLAPVAVVQAQSRERWTLIGVVGVILIMLGFYAWAESRRKD